MTITPERRDSHGRDLPVEVAASVMWLKGEGYDQAAEALRDGYFGPPTGTRSRERGPVVTEEIEPLYASWLAIQRAHEDRAHAVIDAAMAGVSLRDISTRSGLATNTVRGILTDAGLVYQTGRFVPNHPNGSPE